MQAVADRPPFSKVQTRSPYRKANLQIVTPDNNADELADEAVIEVVKTQSIGAFIAPGINQNKILSELYTMAPMVNIHNVSSANKGGDTLGKVAAFMPWATLYTKELKENYSENVILKIIAAAFSTLVFTILGINLSYILLGLVVIAFGDAILGLFPHNITSGTEKDHKLQAKAGAFFTNFFGILVVYKALELISKGTQWVNIVATTLVVAWVSMIYVVRIVKYIAKANNTKPPRVLIDLFERVSKKISN